MENNNKKKLIREGDIYFERGKFFEAMEDYLKAGDNKKIEKIEVEAKKMGDFKLLAEIYKKRKNK